MKISRSGQNTHITRMAMGRMAGCLGMGDDVGAGELNGGVVLL